MLECDMEEMLSFMPECLTRVVLVSVTGLAIGVLAVAQQTPGPVVRHGNCTDVGDADIRYHTVHHKNLSMTLLCEQHIFAGHLADDRANTSNPGSIDVFGRAASAENPASHIERFWSDYLFPGTPLRRRVGADLWAQDQAGLVGDYNLAAAGVQTCEGNDVALPGEGCFRARFSGRVCWPGGRGCSQAAAPSS